MFCTVKTKALEKSKNSVLQEAKTDVSKDIRPNIVFYLADDQDQLDMVVTAIRRYIPSGRSISQREVRFTNAYVAQSICAPVVLKFILACIPCKMDALPITFL